jgi:hypothetical protein
MTIISHHEIIVLFESVFGYRFTVDGKRVVFDFYIVVMFIKFDGWTIDG